ncbi:MAG: tripartite tricarboxylate transporter TctB family protein [Hyphomicrobiaceae bacterium]|nr:tripartite tricarboxylate transporter TctB family protein [Hyphomicrobiaceae bacterium]
MSLGQRLLACLPYGFVLAGAAVLWVLTYSITYAEQPGQIGPTFWPRAAIALMALAALVEIVRVLSAAERAGAVSTIGDTFDEADGVAEVGSADPSRVPHLLIGGFALTFAFALVVGTIGFLLSTFFYLVAFMYLGRYRNHLVVWVSALVGTALLAVIFLKVVYVSLPRGTAPFDAVTQAVIDLLSLF